MDFDNFLEYLYVTGQLDEEKEENEDKEENENTDDKQLKKRR